MSYKITDIVAALREMAHGDRPEDWDEIERRLRERFPNIDIWGDQVNRAFKAALYEAQEEFRERDAEYRREATQLDEALHILEGLGDEVTLGEAIEIKAAQGDLVALRKKAAMSTKRYRVLAALGEAALQAHPHFEQTPDDGDVWRWTGDGKMPSEAAMIDWFQMTHPTEARRIEAEIE